MIRLSDLLEVLGSVSPNEYFEMEKEWKAFCENPLDYKGTPIEDCVRQWLNEFREEHKDAHIVIGGINWCWYGTYTKEEAEKWFEEITGTKASYDWLICEPRMRENPGEYDHLYTFRIHC